MYNERNENFSLKETLLKGLFFVGFIVILVLLFPTRCSLKTTNDINGIFNENLKTMKEAAISYFTIERMPLIEGETKELTLGEMLDEKLLLEFEDSNGKSCSKTESYVMVTKNTDEYLMKINLKCTDKEDYIYVHLGCYDYCEGLLCEKVEAGTGKKEEEKEKEKIHKDDDTKPTTPTVYRYKYVKTTAATYTNWSNWSDWSVTSRAANNTTEVKTNVVKSSTQVKTLVAYKTTTKEDKTKPIYEEVKVEIGSEKVPTSCAKFGVKTTKVSTGNYTYTAWKLALANKEFATVPKDTDTTKYVYNAAANNSCGDCASRMITIYDIYYRTKVLEYETKKEAYCEEYNYETITSTGTSKVLIGYEKVTTKEPIYGYSTKEVSTTYYSYRTRSYTPGSTVYQWSSSINDLTLKNKGYSYTGIKEKVS